MLTPQHKSRIKTRGTMGSITNKEHTPTESLPKDGQQSRPPAVLMHCYTYIFA